MKLLLTIVLSIVLPISLFAQFSVDEYSKYLANHKNMTYEQLLAEYPAGRFLDGTHVDFENLEYSSETNKYLNLTDYEIELIEKNGFMVTSRMKNLSFLSAYFKLYNHDLPVYISSDAILHAMHYSFNKIYQYIEGKFFYNDLNIMFSQMRKEVKYYAGLSKDTVYTRAVKDLDIFLTVGINLLSNTDGVFNESSMIHPAIYEDNSAVVEILKKIYAQQVSELKLFSYTPRLIVFSEFKPRGHYTDTKRLKAYFRTMMWLGYIEILINDSNGDNPKYQQKEIDLRRQTLLAILVSLSAKRSNAIEVIERIEKFQTEIAGKQDNITCFDFIELLDKYGLGNPVDFADKGWSNFIRYRVSQLSNSKQLYSSQILFSDIFNPEQVKPPTVFKLFGQRPVIDGFITSNVVFDRIKYNEKKVFRGLPNTLDILFALKNDAAIQLLENDLTEYKYSSNLASLRYLINSYNDDFWQSSLYNIWLNSIMKLNPPKNREQLPKFMQTAAWWQKTMNTQLASWSQLRHDFILSVKKPYSAGVTCVFPKGFVEPVPELYQSIHSFAEKLLALFKEYEVIYPDNRYGNHNKTQLIKNVLGSFLFATERLTEISNKELHKQELDTNDIKFINNMVSDVPNGCVKTLGGWYTGLYYGYNDFQPNEMTLKTTVDITVADVHTQPTDESGKVSGKVLHCGTGYPNTAVVSFNNTAYTGFVMSYYENISDNFFAYNDNEWRKKIDAGSLKTPEFTNLYLAGKSGGYNGKQISLWTMKEISAIENNEIEDYLHITPNPATNYIDINTNDVMLSEAKEPFLSVKVYDVLGVCVLTHPLSPSREGESVRLDVSDLAAGVYFVRVGGQMYKFVKNNK